MTRSIPLLLLVSSLALAAPAAAQQVSGEIDIGEAASIAGAPIKDGSRNVGTLELSRIGEKIEAVAHFTRRPPGRKASLCLTIAGERHCTKRSAKAGLRLTVNDTAAFDAALRATVRSAEARGSVTL